MAIGVSAYSSVTTPTIPSAVTDPAQSTATDAADSAAASTGTSASDASSSSGGDQVSLSSQAQQLLNRGALVFDAQGATVGGKRVALIDIIDNTDGTYTETERAAAVRQINQRETAGFRWAKPTTDDPTAMKQYYATYLSYLKGLPKEEQDSSRYQGEIDHAQQLIKDADRQIAMQNIQQFNLASYTSDSMGLFGPLASRINQQISQQLAGLPNTNLTTAARYYQAVINMPRTADQVLATADPNASSSDDTSSSSSSGSVSSSTASGGISIQA
jgi:hypothetical protein